MTISSDQAAAERDMRSSAASAQSGVVVECVESVSIDEDDERIAVVNDLPIEWIGKRVRVTLDPEPEPNTESSPLPGYDYWDEHPKFPVADWQYEVANGGTRQGYWDYVMSLLNADLVDDGE